MTAKVCARMLFSLITCPAAFGCGFTIDGDGADKAGGSGGSPSLPAAQAGVAATLDRSTAAGAPSCAFGPVNFVIGNPDGPRSSARDPGQRIVDGMGSDVTCRVAGSDSFLLSADITHAGATFSLKGSAVTPGSATASIELSHPATAGESYGADSVNPCTLLTDALPLEIAPGRIWAKFSCPLLSSQTRPTTAGCAASGEIILENCAQAAL